MPLRYLLCQIQRKNACLKTGVTIKHFSARLKYPPISVKLESFYLFAQVIHPYGQVVISIYRFHGQAPQTHNYYCCDDDYSHESDIQYFLSFTDTKSATSIPKTEAIFS